MSLCTDFDADSAPTLDWPEGVRTPPAGWRWGRHVSMGSFGTGYFLIRDVDGATLIARQRPDLASDDLPTDNELEELLRGVAS